MANPTQHDDRPYFARLLGKSYFGILIILAVLTLIEILLAGALVEPFPFLEPLAFLAGTPTAILILAVMSVAKIVLVAMYYMHLYGDNPFFVAAFLVPVPFVALIVVALLVEFGVLFAG